MQQPVFKWVTIGWDYEQFDWDPSWVGAWEGIEEGDSSIIETGTVMGEGSNEGELGCFRGFAKNRGEDMVREETET